MRNLLNSTFIFQYIFAISILFFSVASVKAGSFYQSPCYTPCSEECRILAQQGDAEALFYYGKAIMSHNYSCGKSSTASDRKKGLVYIKESAGKNYPLAINHLGYLSMRQGKLSEAEKYYKKGADLGNRYSEEGLRKVKQSKASRSFSYICLLLIIFIPFSGVFYSIINKNNVAQSFINYLVYMPIQVTLFILFFINAAEGASGSIIHPILAAFLGFVGWGLLIFVGIVLPLLSIPIYVVLFKKASFRQITLAVTIVIYFLLVIVLWVYMYAMSSFGMQGAGT